MIRKVLLGVLGMLILFGGVGLLVYVFSQGEDEERGVSLTLSGNIIFMEKEKDILITQNSSQQIIQKTALEIASLSLPINEIERLNFIAKKTRLHPETLQEITEEVSLSFLEFFSLLDSNIPSSLLRLFNRDFIFGLHSFTKNNPFLLLTINSYANTFRGMLLWESTMARDLSPIFDLTTLDEATITRQFQDAIIKNQDARVLRDQNGKIVLLYSFANREILIITTHEITLDEIIKRLRRPNKVLR